MASFVQNQCQSFFFYIVQDDLLKQLAYRYTENQN